MGAFLFAAMALIAITMLLLLGPGGIATSSTKPRRAEINAGISVISSSSSTATSQQARSPAQTMRRRRDELQRRLLDDTALADTASMHAQRARHGTC